MWAVIGLLIVGAFLVVCFVLFMTQHMMDD